MRGHVKGFLAKVFFPFVFFSLTSCVHKYVAERVELKTSSENGTNEVDLPLTEEVIPPKAVATEELAPMEMEAVGFDIPIVMNDRVEYFIRFFQTVARDRFINWLKRSSRYVPIMRQILREHGLPEDLVYLAMIESGFNPTARSYRQAVGPWQFIYGTGKKYGLRIDEWVDERRDPIKSTIAAARYLKDLYDQFRCWHLAAAGYNAGEGAISRAISQYQTEDYWELIKYPGLKDETRDYVPKMIAAALIAKNPERYGFGGIDYDPPLRWKEVIAPPSTPLETIALCAGISLATIRDLNPHLLGSSTPPDGPYPVRLPEDAKLPLEVCLMNARPQRKPEGVPLLTHRVKKGETLYGLAKRYGVSVEELKKLNGISDVRGLRVGQEIRIPGRSHEPMRVQRPREYRKVFHVVKQGETLWKIAKTYGVSVEELKRWNKLKQSEIRPNERLLVLLD